MFWSKGITSQKTFLQAAKDILVTFLCWGYFIFAFLFCFSFFYAAAYVFSRDKERAFQYLNHLFFKGFMGLLRVLTPRISWSIDPEIQNLRGAIIVCNHLSYLDPLLFLSLFPHNKTIVKTNFFSAPVFGFLLAVSGYLPSGTEGKYASIMIEQVEKMGGFFESGGNLFVFPEGTRKSGADMERLHKGVFKIVRMYQRPVEVLHLSGTDKLFTPGKFLFNSCLPGTIVLKRVETVEAGSLKEKNTVSFLHRKVAEAFGKERSTGEQAVI